MFWPAVTSSWPACPVEIPSSAVVRGAAAATSGVELRVELGDLVVQERDASCEAAQRELGGVDGLAAAGRCPGAAAGRAPALPLSVLRRELLAQLAGRGDG